MIHGKLIIADIEKISCDEEQILSQIAQRYVEKFHKHKKEKDKKQELIAGYLLKEYLNVEKDEQLVINKEGKPALRNGDIYFNLSHSGKYVVLAVADQEIGVDIERIRPYHEATARKVFSQGIRNQLSELSGEDKDRLFTRRWTELEAKLKVKGIGFSKEWKNEKDKEYFIETRCLDDYFVSAATLQKSSLEIELFAIDRKEEFCMDFKYCKLEIFIPETHIKQLQKALQSVDAGHIGNYDSCMSCSQLTSYWRPLDGTSPYIGNAGEISCEPEVKVEVTVFTEKVDETIQAIKKVHPYEEPVINAIPIYRTSFL